jgi:KaiC/GvpD/RAD55 family RecA-like ATPase
MSDLLNAAKKGPLSAEQNALLRAKGYDAARHRGESGAEFGLIRPEEDWNPEITAQQLAAVQITKARQRLRAEPAEVFKLPYPSVHAMVGQIRVGRLVFVMAHTGNGKTTFALDLLDHCAQAGVKTDYLGTEQEPDELWTKWACKRSGVPADIAINAAWGDYDDDLAQTRVEDGLVELELLYGDIVRFAPEKFVTLQAIESAAQSAYDRGATVLFVDHIDRVEHEGDLNDFAAMRRLVRRLKELMRDCALVGMVLSQVSREARGGDRLGAYFPPQIQHMRGAGTKEEEADAVLGLWRPLRGPIFQETVKEYQAVMQACRHGQRPVADILSTNLMGVVLLKHRTRSAIGRQTMLTLRGGSLYEQSGYAPRTNPDEAYR